MGRCSESEAAGPVPWDGAEARRGLCLPMDKSIFLYRFLQFYANLNL